MSLFKIKKWFNMICGKSVYHVNQNEGLCYSIDEVKGYYNNLTEKVTRFSYPDNKIPITQDDDGRSCHFSIAIFQYGLAAYDLWILNREPDDLEKFKNCVDWTIENQETSGAWKTFERQNSKHPYSAMAQGEGVSLLCRAYLEFGEKLYIERAYKAVNFLLKSRVEGGVCDKSESILILYEYTYLPLVLNGWIFASWGLFDYFKITNDERVGKAWNITVKTMADSLERFDNNYWSLYDLGGAITSPFYHKLHIAQLNVMAILTGQEQFKKYAEIFSKYNKSRCKQMHAFCVKVFQKLIE